MTRDFNASDEVVLKAYSDVVQAFTGRESMLFRDEYCDTLDADPRAVAAHFAALAGTTLEALEETP